MVLSPERIRASRVAAGFSRRELARMVGVSDRTILRCEQGRHSPRSDLLGRLACALGVEVGSFYARADGDCPCGNFHPPEGGSPPDPGPSA